MKSWVLINYSFCDLTSYFIFELFTYELLPFWHLQPDNDHLFTVWK